MVYRTAREVKIPAPQNDHTRRGFEAASGVVSAHVGAIVCVYFLQWSTLIVRTLTTEDGQK